MSVFKEFTLIYAIFSTGLISVYRFQSYLPIETPRKCAIRFATYLITVNEFPGCIAAVDGITIGILKPKKLQPFSLLLQEMVLPDSCASHGGILV